MCGVLGSSLAHRPAAALFSVQSCLRSHGPLCFSMSGWLAHVQTARAGLSRQHCCDSSCIIESPREVWLGALSSVFLNVGVPGLEEVAHLCCVHSSSFLCFWARTFVFTSSLRSFPGHCPCLPQESRHPPAAFTAHATLGKTVCPCHSDCGHAVARSQAPGMGEISGSSLGEMLLPSPIPVHLVHSLSSEAKWLSFLRKPIFLYLT